jgi:hypothetical protein
MERAKLKRRTLEPTRRLDLFGPPPLLEGEDAAAYDELLLRVSTAVKPVDILEDIWVRDIVDLTWEVFRLRRLKMNLMTASAYKALVTVLEEIGDIDEETHDSDEETGGPDEMMGDLDNIALAKDWARRNPEAIKEVNRILSSAHLTMDAVMAQTLFNNIDHAERIERMSALAEARRNLVLREVDRHRATLGQDLRRTVRHIEDGKFQVLEGKTAKGKTSA